MSLSSLTIGLLILTVLVLTLLIAITCSRALRWLFDDEQTRVHKFLTAIEAGHATTVFFYVLTGIMQTEFQGEPLIIHCLSIVGIKDAIWDILLTAVPSAVSDPKLSLLSKHLCHGNRLEILLRLGANPNNMCADQQLHRSALNEAISSHAPLDSLRLLLEYGADPNQIDYRGRTALQEAVSKGHAYTTQVIKLLLSAGADPNMCSDNSPSALYLAIEWAHWHPPCKGQLENIKLLLDAKSDPNYIASCMGKRSLLWVAIEMTPYSQMPHKLQVDIVRSLIEHGTNVNLRNTTGCTALMLAVRQETSLEIVNMLLKAGGSLTMQDHFNHTVLHHAVLQVPKIDPRIIKSILNYGADPNMVNACQKTPLVLALQNANHLETLLFLIEGGTDVNIADQHGCTALHHAAGNQVKCIPDVLVVLTALFNNGAKINNTSLGGKTALMLAMIENQFESAQFLIDAGADLKIKDKSNNTALHYAAINIKNVQQLKLLIDGNLELFAWENSKNQSVFLLLVLMCIKTQNMDFLNYILELSASYYDEQNMKLLLAQSQNIFLEDPFALVTSVYKYPEIFKLLFCPVQEQSNNVLNVKFSWNKYASLRFCCSHRYKCNVITLFVSKIERSVRNNDETAEVWIKCLNLLETYGFQVLPSDPICISPLTALFTCFHTRNINNFDHLILAKRDEAKVVKLAKYLIQRGASVTDRKFQFVPFYQSEIRDQYPVPDSLWLAAMAGYVDVVRLLLPYWRHPPLALLVHILPQKSYADFFSDILLPLYPTLAAGGQLPRGSPIYRAVVRLLRGSNVDLIRLKLHFKSMHQNEGKVQSLRSLCRVVVRASQPAGVELPQRLRDLVPPGLKNYLQLDFDTAEEIEQQLKDVHIPADELLRDVFDSVGHEYLD